MDWNTTPTPKDGTRVIVADYSHDVDEFTPPASVLRCVDGLWQTGDLCIGEQGDDFPLWMPYPEASAIADWSPAPAPKDGSWLLVHWNREGKDYFGVMSWQNNWAASDLGLDGVWSDGCLSNTSEEPDHWTPIPEKPPAPTRTSRPVASG